MTNSENRGLHQRIKEWNATRLDLFKISEPNKRNEFHGVVRFFFQGDDSKYQAKCLRISNTATACQLVNVLVEKFHPDLKRLTAGRYALYEYHASSGERRLGANEAPLLVQLNWAFDDSEVRFVLRDENKPLPSARQRIALENQPSSLQNGGTISKAKPRPYADANHSDGDVVGAGSFARRWSSGSRKKKKKIRDDNHRDPEQESIPETTFTRTLSNPDEVLRRRRQQRIQHRTQHENDTKESDNSVKIYGDSINPEVPYIILRLSVDDTADKVVYWALEQYGIVKQVNPQDYCLVQLNIPQRGERLPAGMKREITLHQHDCPLAIRAQLNSLREPITCVFQIRHRRAVGKDGRRPPAAAPSKARGPSTVGNTLPKRLTLEPQEQELCHYLVEVSGDADHAEMKNGLFASLNELFTHSYSGAIRLGTIEKMVGPPPNILVDKSLHPDIRPVHCTFNVVLASTTGSKWRLPSSGQPEELESLTQYSLLVTPSLDGFAKPPGPAAIRVNDTRITGPMILQPDTILRLGKSLWLKFIRVSEKMDYRGETITPQATTERMGNETSQNQKDRSIVRVGGNHLIDTVRNNPVSTVAPMHKKVAHSEHSRVSAPPNLRSTGEKATDQLPLTIEVQGAAEWTNKASLLDRYVHLIDEVLRGATTELHNMNTRNKEDGRPAIFSLSPAYALYLVYRACQTQVTSFCGSSISDKEHTVSYISNYIATRVFESLPKASSEAVDRLTLIQPLVYWLANSSELLQFLKNDVSLCLPSNGQVLETSRRAPPLHADRQALHLLADAVDHCFYELRSCMALLMHPLMNCLVHTGDGDMQDDLRLDDRAILPESYHDSLQQPARIQAIMQLFTLLMHQIRRARVNASLTIQLFAQLFHLVNSHIFNQALVKSEAKPRHIRDSANIWLSRPGASRLLRRLDRIKHWAQRQGLEIAAECRLQKCVQACQLVLADRSNLDEFYQLCMGLLSLNSIQLEWLLSHLTDPPPVPDDWIDLIVTGGREVNDRAILDEMEHYNQNGQNELPIPELQLSEPKELPLPLLLPPDGYASDAILTGTPAGLTEFLRPFVSKGLIQVQRNPIVTGSKDSRPWTCYLRLSKVDLNDRSKLSSFKERTRYQSVSNTEESDVELSDSGSEDGNRFEKTNHSYRPRESRAGVSLRHTSLPNLSTTPFDSLAKEANVPVDSITRFYLRKYNNSLGLSIVAAKAEGQRHYGIYVKDIVPGGAADRDGRLDTGDQILVIGDSNLIGCAQSDAVATLAKQCQSDEGVQLTVAQGAAKYHRILELTRSTVSTRSRLQQSNHAQSENERPPSDKHYRTGPTTQISATYTGQRMTSQQRHATNKPDEGNIRGLKNARRFVEAGRQGGSLSRSTPSLNLAEVGMDDSDYAAEEETRKSKVQLPTYPQQRDHRTPVDDINSFTRTKSLELAAKQRSKHMESVPRKKQLIGTTTGTSSDSDELREVPASRRHEGRRSDITTENYSHGNYMERLKPVSTLHSSQPNMSKPVIFHQTNRHGSLSMEPGRMELHTQPKEMGSDASSIGSVSSSQTPCSLHEANGTIIPTRTTEEKTRTRHPPPPTVPSQKHKGHAAEENPWHFLDHPHVSASELINPHTDKRHSNSSRPQSALDNPSGSCATLVLQETSLNSPLDHRPVRKAFASRQSDEPGSQTVLTTGNLSSNRSTVHLKDDQLNSTAMPPPVSLPPTPVDEFSTKLADTNTTTNWEPPRSHHAAADISGGPATKIASATVADVSHGQFTMGKPTAGLPMEDSLSETLKPPTHAVVPTTRWADDRVPAFAPELRPDVPALHIDPQRGRTNHGSSLIHLDAVYPNNSEDTGSTVRAEFGLANQPVQMLPPRASGLYQNPVVRRSPSPQGRQPRQQFYDPFSKQCTDTVPPNAFNQNSRDAVPPALKLNTLVPPPPTPTADFPQYHPPERLEPADWSTYKPSEPDRAPESRYGVGPTAPQVAPKPQVSLPYGHRQPAPSTTNRPPLEGIGQTSQTFLRHPSSMPPSYVSKQPALSSSSQYATSAAARVAQLETELRMMELRRGDPDAGDTDQIIDRLQAELQFQRRLAEREELRKHPSARNEQSSSVLYHGNTVDDELNEFRSPVDDFQSSQHEWEHKRGEAERELEISQQRRLKELEQEHRMLLARQEQRAKERAEWFGQHKERTQQRFTASGVNSDDSSRSRQATTNSHFPQFPLGKESGYHNPSTDPNSRYGRPRFDDKQQDSRGTVLTSPYPIQSKSGPQVIETELSRMSSSFGLNDSMRVKKSVSFDKNLETISVYSPPTTPQDSGTEKLASKQPSSAGIMGQSFFPTSVTAPGLVPRSTSSGTLARIESPPAEPPIRSTAASPNPVQNAELLPFKEKMRLFAQRIGEEPPKERSKVSSLQKQLLAVGSTTSTRPSYNYEQNTGQSFGR